MKLLFSIHLYYLYIYIWYTYICIYIFDTFMWQIYFLCIIIFLYPIYILHNDRLLIFFAVVLKTKKQFHLYVFTNFFDIRKQSLRATLKKGVSNISGSKIKHVNFWIYFDFFEFLVQCEINYYQRRLVSIIFFIISEFSLRRRFSKISHGADTGDNNILY